MNEPKRAKGRNICWADFPDEIVQVIMKRLCRADKIVVSSSCKNWWNLYNNGMEDTEREEVLPWVISYSQFKGAQKLFDPVAQKSYNLKPLQYYPYFYYALPLDTKNGWMLFSKGVHYGTLLFFYSPFTNQVIDLPIINRVCKVGTFSSDPTSPDCTVIVTVTTGRNRFEILIYRFDDKRWKTILRPRSDVLQIFYSGNSFHCLERNATIRSFDICKREWRFLPKTGLKFRNHPKLIVTFKGDLLLTFNRNLVENCRFDEDSADFWRLDVSEKQAWIPVSKESLAKNHVLFSNRLQQSHLFSVPHMGNARPIIGGTFHFPDTFCPIEDHLDRFNFMQVYSCFIEFNVEYFWIQPPFSKGSVSRRNSLT